MARRRDTPKTPTFSDDELAEALAQFNTGVEKSRADEKAAKALARADRARKAAADELRAVRENPNASAEQIGAADEAYREALEAWTTLSRGDEPEAQPAEGEPETQTPETAD